jgi:hypothetical protein
MEPTVPARIGLPIRLGMVLCVLFVALALVRGIDHDESQYVAAALLSAHGDLPYRDYAYLQTPLQPVLFAPIAWIAGTLTWPALRLVNALLGVVLVGCVWRASREAGAGPRAALWAAVLFATCDAFLFSIATARNDALPAALFGGALVLIVRAGAGRGSTTGGGLAGALLAAAAAAKISYALPAVGYGLYALFDRRHRPLAVLAGALPIVALVGWTWAQAPAGFIFGTLTFPARAPAEYYHMAPWKMSWTAKAVDVVKFLALGPALIAVALALRGGWRRSPVVAVVGVAGLIAAVLPFPTWRQYLLPMLPPLFVLLALAWEQHPPVRWVRIAAVVLVCAGVAPRIAGLVAGGGGGTGRVPLLAALRDGRAVRAALDRAGVAGPVATLSPQFLAATGRLPDARFATGPFYFRSHALVAPGAEAGLRLVSGDRLDVLASSPASTSPAKAGAQLRPERYRALRSPTSTSATGPRPSPGKGEGSSTVMPAAILVGGEDKWSSGNPALDIRLERWAIAHQYRAVRVASPRFRLYVRQP